MEFDYFITRIDTNNTNTADLLITPLRWLVGGRRYMAIRNGRSEFSHAIAYEKSHPLINVVKRIVGLIGTVVLFPIVGIGLALKAYQISDISKENYAYITSITTNNKAKFLSKKAISIAPTPIPMLPQNDPQVIAADLQELVNLWSSAGKDHSEFQEISNQIRSWVTDTVPDPSKYNYISQETAPAASAELQYYLKLLIIELKAKNNQDITERVILELINASKKCSPTWLEVATREYRKLKSGNLVNQQILQYLREVKEDLIMEYANKNEQDSQWHVINYARWILGDEFGLDRSHLDYDSVIQQKVLEDYPKEKCREIFYSIFKLEEITPRIQAKIEMEYAGTNLSIQFYGQTLSEIADKHAASSGVDIESDNYDSLLYSMSTFFDLRDDKHYILNNTGVEALLEILGIVQ